MKNRNMVVHSDKITKGRSKLSTVEMKAFLATVTTIDAKNDDDFKEVVLSKDEFCGDTNLDFRTVKSICQKLVKQVYEIQGYENGKPFYKGYPIYQMFEYKKETDEIRFKFNDYMKPYLLELREKFTKYEIKNIINMTSKYSIRTYQILKNLRDSTRQQEFELEEFCDWLEVPKSKRNWGNFQLDIMQLVIKEINELTDLKILGIFPERKKGKKVLSFSLKFCTGGEYDDAKKLNHKGLRQDEIEHIELSKYHDQQALINGEIITISAIFQEASLKFRVVYLSSNKEMKTFSFESIKEIDKAIKKAAELLDDKRQQSLF